MKIMPRASQEKTDAMTLSADIAVIAFFGIDSPLSAFQVQGGEPT